MKPLLIALLIFFACDAFSQQEEFHVQGQIVDPTNNPISDVYVINFRTQSKYITNDNGVFDAWVYPNDSLILIHVTFLRKTVPVFDLMKNPIIQLAYDTVNIKQIDVLSEEVTDIDRAAENLRQINFDPRPRASDSYTEEGRMTELLNTENKVERAAASSLTYQFSPSAVIENIIEKIRLRKKANEYYSTKKNPEKQEP